MPTLSERIIELSIINPGLSDREITDTLLGPSAQPQAINQACRLLARRGRLIRRTRADGRIANFPLKHEAPQSASADESVSSEQDPLSEDAIKAALERWLQSREWTTAVAWRASHGVDIEARRDAELWVIEVKGRGSRPEMRVNYFLAIMGELLQRMHHPKGKYSIALPDLEQFRGLWERLPALAKSRTTITALFVDETGRVEEST